LTVRTFGNFSLAKTDNLKDEFLAFYSKLAADIRRMKTRKISSYLISGRILDHGRQNVQVSKVLKNDSISKFLRLIKTLGKKHLIWQILKALQCIIFLVVQNKKVENTLIRKHFLGLWYNYESVVN